jgi:hypothetical protein
MEQSERPHRDHPPNRPPPILITPDDLLRPGRSASRQVKSEEPTPRQTSAPTSPKMPEKKEKPVSPRPQEKNDALLAPQEAPKKARRFSFSFGSRDDG